MKELGCEIQIKKKKARTLETAAATVIAVFFYLSLVLLVFTLSFTFCPVEGMSMFPTIRDGQNALLNKWDYRYERGEIIVFNKGDVKLIKRIIGVGGDKIEIKESEGVISVWRNDEMLVEEYIREDMLAWWTKPDFANRYGVNISLNTPVIIPDGEYCVFGDNRNNSLDSRVMFENPDKTIALGFVKESEIEGSLAFLIPENTFLEWVIRLIFGDLWRTN